MSDIEWVSLFSAAEESALLDQITSNMAASRLSNVRSSVPDPVQGGVPANKPAHTIQTKPGKTGKLHTSLM